MLRLGIFLVGFASGWMTRSAVDSSRELAVSVMATAYATWERVRRAVAVERERMEDLVAEARARQQTRGPSARDPSSEPHAAVSRAHAA
jgi:hypothetical protein